MKAPSLIYALAWWMACCLLPAAAQPPSPAAYRYEYFNTAHGLPSSDVYALARDSTGFLWTGTAAGLSRFDGYSFINYQYSDNQELMGTVNVIKADAQNRLWIGCGSGLFCRTGNRLVKLNTAARGPQAVNDLLIDAEDTIWLATEAGPAKVHVSQFDFTGARQINLASFILPQWLQLPAAKDNRAVVVIAIAPDKTVYFAQYHHLFRLLKGRIEWLHTLAQKNEEILSVFPVSNRTVFFDASSTELHRLDNGVHTNPRHDAFVLPGKDAGKPGFWYLGSSGIFFFHPLTGTASVFINTLDKGVTLPRKMLTENGVFWVATMDGLVKITPSFFTAHNLLHLSPHTDYYSVLQLRSGKLLLGSNRGIVLEKKDTGFAMMKKGLVPKAEIKCMLEDERGWLWAGSGYQGLALMRNNKTEQFTKNEGLHDNTILCLFKTRDNRLYAAGDHGLSELLVDEKHNISFRRYYYESRISKNAHFYSIVEAPDGNLWTAGEEGILYLRNGMLYPFLINGRPQPANAMISSKNGTVWIAAAGGGILKCRFNEQHELQVETAMGEKQGLGSLNYLTLTADKDNNIWAGSSEGISFIGQSELFQNRVINFDRMDGFPGPGFSYMQLGQDSTGTMWAATTTGLVSFDPRQLLYGKAQPPLVHITGVWQKGLQLPYAVAGGSTRFAYHQNAFKFSFTGLDDAGQEGVRYYYKLEGLDTGWIYSGLQRSVNYENLAPGGYAFHVKAISTKGVWSESDAVYSFYIKTPFWRQWWFLLAVLLLTAAAVYFYFQQRERRIRDSEARKTEIEKLKAGSLQYQLEIEQVTSFFSASMNQQNSVDDLLWDVSRNCISKLGFEDCVIYLVDEQRNVLVQKAAWGPKTSRENSILNPIEIAPGLGIVGHVAASGLPQLVADTSADSRYIVDDARRLSELAVPIIKDNRTIGVIDTEHPQPGFYTERHLQILTTIASLLADKIGRLEAQQQTHEKELEVLRLSKDLAGSQLMALRSQMNPHFLFNAMNSIQQFTLQGDTDNANRYLTKFSLLLRKVLQSARENFLPLEDEIEQLRLYLDIEQLRIGPGFIYTITVDDDIEPDACKIPAMAIQPFVENSLKHGLPLKEDRQQLDILFSLQNDDTILVRIADNGIGRRRSAEIRAVQEKLLPHESKGIHLITERLRLLNPGAGEAIRFEDPVDESGRSTGVIVWVRLPLENSAI